MQTTSSSQILDGMIRALCVLAKKNDISNGGNLSNIVLKEAKVINKFSNIKITDIYHELRCMMNCPVNELLYGPVKLHENDRRIVSVLDVFDSRKIISRKTYEKLLAICLDGWGREEKDTIAELFRTIICCAEPTIF